MGIFSEAKGIVGKTLKVKRVFDEKSKNIVYIVYTERLNKDDDPNGSRFKSQACAVHLDGFSEAAYGSRSGTSEAPRCIPDGEMEFWSFLALPAIPPCRNPSI